MHRFIVAARTARAFARDRCHDGLMRRSHDDQPALITTAPESSDDEYDRRRKKYAIMMALRAVCVIAAACTYRVSIVLALAFVVAGLVLPWCAVLIANDRPGRASGDARARRAARLQHRTRPARRADDGRTARRLALDHRHNRRA